VIRDALSFEKEVLGGGEETAWELKGILTDSEKTSDPESMVKGTSGPRD